LTVFLVLSAAALCAAACGDSEPVTTTSIATVQETATSAVSSTVPATSPATSEQPTDTAPPDTAPLDTVTTETTAVSGTSVVELGNADNGHEVVLNPGDRVRISLKPYVNDRVKSVRWEYMPIVVQETDSGSEIISEVVVEAWLELEAAIVGPVTVRAAYEYPYGTVKTVWVVYLIVEEPEEEEEADGK
jgi:hypothetical protein